jgi:hypothetical protein
VYLLVLRDCVAWNMVRSDNEIWAGTDVKEAVSYMKIVWRGRTEENKEHITHRPDGGGSKDLWNVGKLLPDYTVLQPRRQPSSYSPRENLKSYLVVSDPIFE